MFNTIRLNHLTQLVPFIKTAGTGRRIALSVLTLLIVSAPPVSAQVEPPAIGFDLDPIGRFARITVLNPVLNVRETMFLSTGELTNSQTLITADGVHATVAFEKDADRDIAFSLTRGTDVFSFGLDFHPFKPGGVTTPDKLFPMKWTMTFNGASATTPAISGNESAQALEKKFDGILAVARHAQTSLWKRPPTPKRAGKFFVIYFCKR